MPRLLCFGAQGKDVVRIGKREDFRVASVQQVAEERCKVLLLPCQGGGGADDGGGGGRTAGPGTNPGGDVKTWEVDGYVDVSDPAKAAKRSTLQHTAAAIAERIQERHNNTVIFHGTTGTGKSTVLSLLVPMVLAKAKAHIDTSGRDAKAKKEEERLQRHKELSEHRREQEKAKRDEARRKARHSASYIINSAVLTPRPPLSGSPKKRAPDARATNGGDPPSILSKTRHALYLHEIQRRTAELERDGIILVPQPPAALTPKSAKTQFVSPPPAHAGTQPASPAQRSDDFFDLRSPAPPPARAGPPSRSGSALFLTSPLDHPQRAATSSPLLSPRSDAAPRSPRGRLGSNVSARSPDSPHRAHNPKKPGPPGSPHGSAQSPVLLKLPGAALPPGLCKDGGGDASPNAVSAAGDASSDREQAEPVRVPVSGGRCGSGFALNFLPENRAHVRLPRLPRLNEAGCTCVAAFWVKTGVKTKKMAVVDIADMAGSCRLTVHFNVTCEDEIAPGVVRFALSDSLHKPLEGHALFESLCNDEWHHVSCHCINSRENQLEIRVDGVPLQLYINGLSEEPFSFLEWHPFGVLGAEMLTAPPEEGAELDLRSFFEGSIAEFSLQDSSTTPRRLLSRMPLAVSIEEGRRSEGTTVKEAVTGAVGTTHGTHWAHDVFPQTGVYFNGCYCVNVGTLGSFGARMNAFSVEFWLKTTERKERMAVLQVTDSRKKQMSVGVVLNASGPDTRPDAVTFTLRDTTGAEMTCWWAPPSGREITDGLWHHVQWKVADASTNTCFVKIDGCLQDVAFLTRAGPSAFAPFTDFLCIGGHNRRGRLCDTFKGMLRHVILSGSQSIFASWGLCEGPGAKLALDSGDPFKDDLPKADDPAADPASPLAAAGDGCGLGTTKVRGIHHGAYTPIFPHTRAGGRGSVYKTATEWYRGALPEPEHQDGAFKSQQDKRELARWRSNAVRAACLSIEAGPVASSGNFVEILTDVAHDEVVTLLDDRLQAVTASKHPVGSAYGKKKKLGADQARAGVETVEGVSISCESLPDSVWETFSSAEQLQEFFKRTLAAVEPPPRGGAGSPTGASALKSSFGAGSSPPDFESGSADSNGDARSPSRKSVQIIATPTSIEDEEFPSEAGDASSARSKPRKRSFQDPAAGARLSKGHHIWIFSVGDSMTTFVDLSGIQQPDSAVYDAGNKRWYAASTNIGAKARMSACLNKGSFAVEACLAAVGSFPMLYLRSLMDDPSLAEKECWTSSLTTRILKRYGVLDHHGWSHLYLFHATALQKKLSAVELSHSECILDTVAETSRRQALESLAKLAAQVRAKCVSRNLKRQLLYLTTRRAQARLLLAKYPSARLKERKRALVVASWRSGDRRLGASYELMDNALRVAAILRKIGFDVIFMHSASPDPRLQPTRARLIEKVSEATAEDSMWVVYIAARSGGRREENSGFVCSRLLWLLEEESIVREETGEEESDARSAILTKELQDRVKRKGHRGSGGSLKSIHSNPRLQSPTVVNPRLVPGSGGAGKLKKHHKKDRHPSTEMQLLHANDQAALIQEESLARDATATLGANMYRLLSSYFTEQLLYLSNPPPLAPSPYLILDDTPPDPTDAEALTLSALSDAIIPKGPPSIGVHRVFAVDAAPWRGTPGFFSFETTSQEHVKAEYGGYAHGLGTLLVEAGLTGQAQEPEGPLAIPAERATVGFAALARYVARRAKKKRSAFLVQSERTNGCLVGETVLCSSLCKAPEAWAAEKEAARQPKAAPKVAAEPAHGWLLVSIPAYSDATASDVSEFALRALTQAAPQARPSVTESRILPVLDVFYDTPSRLSWHHPAALRQLRADATNAKKLLNPVRCPAGLELSCHLFGAGLPASCAVSAQGRQALRLPGADSGRISRDDCLAIRVYPTVCASFTEQDLRLLLPERVDVEGNANVASHFVSDASRKFRRDHGAAAKGAQQPPAAAATGLPSVAGARLHALVRFKACGTEIRAILKALRAGGGGGAAAPAQLSPPSCLASLAAKPDAGRPHKAGVEIVEAGSFSGEGWTEYQVLVASSADRLEHRAIVQARTRREEGRRAADAAAAASAAAALAAAHAGEKKAGRAGSRRDANKVADAISVLTSEPTNRVVKTGVDLPLLFSMREEELMVSTCRALLVHLKPPETRHGLQLSFVGRFVKVLIASGLWKVVKGLLEDGTSDVHGVDSDLVVEKLLSVLREIAKWSPGEVVKAKDVVHGVLAVARRYRHSVAIAGEALHTVYRACAVNQTSDDDLVAIAEAAPVSRTRVELAQACLLHLSASAPVQTPQTLLPLQRILAGAIPSSVASEELLYAAKLALFTLLWAAGLRSATPGQSGGGGENGENQASAASEVARAAVQLAFVAASSSRHGALVTEDVLLSGLANDASPFDRSLEVPSMVGPGVMQCQECGALFTESTRPQELCRSTTARPPRHSGELVDGNIDLVPSLGSLDDTPRISLLDVLAQATPALERHPLSLGCLLGLVALAARQEAETSAELRRSIVEHPASVIATLDDALAGLSSAKAEDVPLHLQRSVITLLLSLSQDEELQQGLPVTQLAVELRKRSALLKEHISLAVDGATIQSALKPFG